MILNEQPQTATIGKLIDRMLELRDQRSELANQDKELKAEFETLEQQVLIKLREQDTVRGCSEKGTATISELTVPTIENWDEFEEFIYENRAFYLLEKRPAGAAYRELLQQGEEIPGLKPFTRYSISLRKSR